MRNFTLFISLMLFASKASAQLQAHAGADTVWCKTSMGIAPQLGDDPSATGGTPPYSYEWRIAGQSNPAIGILNSAFGPHPHLQQDPGNVDSLAFVLRVADAPNTVAYDTVVVAFSRWTYTLGQCMIFKGQMDTVTLQPNGWSNFPPIYRQWVPPFSLSSDTASAPRSWTPVNTHYYATAIDRKGCQSGGGDCSVTVVPAQIIDTAPSTDDIRFSPNPITLESRIEIPSALLGSELRIFSIDGRLMRTLQLQSASTSLGAILPLAPSAYFYRIGKHGSPPHTGKMIVQE